MSTPVYNPRVPNKITDTFKDSQPDLLNNFSVLYDVFQINHVALDAIANAGNHTNVEFLEQKTAFQTDVSEISLYAKEVIKQADQLFLHYQGNAGQEFQYTAYQLYPIPATSTVSMYFSFLPGNIIVYFGMFNPNSANTFVLDLVPPVAKNIISVSHCNIAPVPSFVNTGKSSVNILDDDEEYVAKIQFGPVFLGGKLYPTYFFIMANL